MSRVFFERVQEISPPPLGTAKIDAHTQHEICCRIYLRI